MESSWWRVLVVPVLMIPSAISVVACIVYAARARSRLAYFLAIGVTGGLIVSAATQLFNWLVVPRIFVSKGFSSTLNVVDSVQWAATLVFGLVFSVSLFLLLRALRLGRPGLGEARSTAGETAETLIVESPVAKGRQWGPGRSAVGFAWGLALGIVGVLIVGSGGLIVANVLASSSPRSNMLPQVVVSPTSAGTPWFSVGLDGAGTMQGWDMGRSGSADANGGTPPKGAVIYFDIGTVGVADGVLIQHEVPVYLTRSTMFVIGGRPYDKGKAASEADSMFGDAGTDILDSRLLTIDFHRVGNMIVADVISAAAKREVSPLLQ